MYTLCNMGARVALWSDFHLGCFGGDSVSSHGRKRVRETCSDVTGDDLISRVEACHSSLSLMPEFKIAVLILNIF